MGGPPSVGGPGRDQRLTHPWPCSEGACPRQGGSAEETSLALFSGASRLATGVSRSSGALVHRRRGDPRHHDGHRRAHHHRRLVAVDGDPRRPDVVRHPNRRLGLARAHRRPIPGLAQAGRPSLGEVDDNGEAARSSAVVAPRNNAARDDRSNTRWNSRGRNRRGPCCTPRSAGSSCLLHRVHTHWSTHPKAQSELFVDTSWRPPGPLNSTDQRRWSATITWR